METLIKKVIYTGVGIASAANEKVQTRINEWVEKGKVSEEEGKKVVDDLLNDTDTKKEEVEGKIRDYVENFLAKFDFPTRNEVSSLQEKLNALEAKLETSTKEPEVKEVVAEVKKAAPKTTRRRTTKKTTDK
jgi:polyhydroxyalkanoate synthesis regulator phasin